MEEEKLYLTVIKCFKFESVFDSFQKIFSQFEKTKLVFVDGPIGAGKSEFINRIKTELPSASIIKEFTFEKHPDKNYQNFEISSYKERQNQSYRVIHKNSSSITT